MRGNTFNRYSLYLEIDEKLKIKLKFECIYVRVVIMCMTILLQATSVWWCSVQHDRHHPSAAGEWEAEVCTAATRGFEAIGTYVHTYIGCMCAKCIH